MRIDKELQKMLAEKIQHYQDRVPVFKIRNANAKEMHRESIKLLMAFTDAEQFSAVRYDTCRKENHTQLKLQENASFRYYHASGYKEFQKNTPPFEKVVSDAAENTDVASLKARACDVLEKNKLNITGAFEQLKFENMWQLKSSGMTLQKEIARTTINRLVYAYRRFVNELPVLGAASVYIKTAADYELDAFGIDWRNVHEDPLTVAKIISPEDAAASALSQLQNTNPEKVFTAKDFNVEGFSLGYFSNSKTNYQSILQPVYVAKFISKGFSRQGHIIVVPAAGGAYESICRKITAPPFSDSVKGKVINKNNVYTSATGNSGDDASKRC